MEKMILHRRLQIVFFLSFFFFTCLIPPCLLAGNNAISKDEMTDTVLDMYRGYKKKFPEAHDISASEARELFDQGKVVFIDVRTPEEQAVSMLPGAFTENEFLKDPDAFQDKIAVAYCTIGYRSGVFSEKMGKQGLRVLNLSGGILAWVLDGGTVYSDGEMTKRVHVYGKKWDYLPEGFEAVMF